MFTGPTGTNAVEAAMKLARKVTGRRNIIAFTNGFHGVTAGRAGLHRQRQAPRRRRRAAGGRDACPTTAFSGRRRRLRRSLDRMLDNPSSGIDAGRLHRRDGAGRRRAQRRLGGNGCAASSARAQARRAADRRRHPGRLRPHRGFFSFEEMGISPDIVTLAKSLSGMGLPFAMVLMKPEHDIWTPAEHNGTFRGNNHAFVTARVALEKFWKDGALREQVRAKGEFAGSAAARDRRARSPAPRLKGRGMMRGIDVGRGELASRSARLLRARPGHRDFRRP
jgi:diaminobutyrate-2-oxoglutarate transaminase